MTANNIGVKLAVAGALVAGAALTSTATAYADPPPPDVPVDPAAPAPPAPPAPNGIPPLAELTSPLAQTGTSSQPLSGGLLTNPFAGNQDNEYFLAQNPLPEAPSGAPGATPPNLTAFNNAYLLPQNLTPSAPGQGQLYDVAPGDENANVGPLDPFRRMHHMHVDGYLKGGLLGQRPQEELGQPLAGTAPPAGTAVPPGLVQYLPDPAAPPDPALPPPPPAG